MLSSEPEPSAFRIRDITNSSSPQDMEKRLSVISLGGEDKRLSFASLDQEREKRHSIASLPSLEVSPSKHSECEGGSRLANSESLHNLSLAILRRQQLEAEDASLSLPPVPANTLVDQVGDTGTQVDRICTRGQQVQGIKKFPITI